MVVLLVIVSCRFENDFTPKYLNDYSVLLVTFKIWSLFGWINLPPFKSAYFLWVSIINVWIFVLHVDVYKFIAPNSNTDSNSNSLVNNQVDHFFGYWLYQTELVCCLNIKILFSLLTFLINYCSFFLCSFKPQNNCVGFEAIALRYKRQR